jgi:hypothetical protein
MVVHQVEKLQPVQPHDLDRGAGHGIGAINPGAPDDLFETEQFPGAIAETLTLLADHFDDAAAHAVDRIGAVAATEHVSPRRQRDHLTIQLG